MDLYISDWYTLNDWRIRCYWHIQACNLAVFRYNLVDKYIWQSRRLNRIYYLDHMVTVRRDSLALIVLELLLKYSIDRQLLNKVDVNDIRSCRTNYSPIIIHLINGSPVYLGLQLQIGLWFITLHSAAIPQVPGHGSIHFWFTQALFKAHSELVTHSGLHVGGLPI